MMKVEYVSGFAKSIIDVKVLASVFLQAIKKYGLFKGLTLMIDYFSDKRSLFKDIPARYVKKGKDYFAIAELPPVNHHLFAEYIVKDMAALRGMAKPIPAFAIVCISTKCPYKCHYCYNSEMHADAEKLSVNQLVLTINCLVDSGIRNIYLSGGEPMMRWNDLLQILERCQNRQITFWLLTTGWGITEEKIVQLIERDVTGIMITLDSENPETVAAIKGESGAYQNAIHAIRLSAANGLIAVINTVFTKDILEEYNFERFVAFVGQNGATFINCNTQKDAQNADGENTPIFTPTDCRKLGKLTRQNNKKRRSLPITYSPDFWESRRGCVGGKLFLYMDPEGNFRPCPFSSLVIGNIFNQPVADIVRKASQLGNIKICRQMSLLIEGIQKK